MKTRYPDDHPAAQTNATISRAVLVALAARNVQVPEAATRMGMGVQSLRDRLSGKSGYSAEDVAAIAYALDIDPAWLFQDPAALADRLFSLLAEQERREEMSRHPTAQPAAVHARQHVA